MNGCLGKGRYIDDGRNVEAMRFVVLGVTSANTSPRLRIASIRPLGALNLEGGCRSRGDTCLVNFA